MRVLIYGHAGWIGQMMEKHLLEKGHQCIHAEARANDYQLVKNEIETVKPDCIFSSIGRTHGVHKGKVYSTIDYLELDDNLKYNVSDNLVGPIVLADICSRLNVHLTYIGTGCIFTYDDTHKMPIELNNSDLGVTGFTEDDKPNFYGSSYSIVKGQTDMLIKNYDNVLNCRIRMPITADYNRRNFITKIINYEKICSIPNSMTVLPELLPIIIDMMERKEVGTFNMTNPSVITHNQILDMYKSIIDPAFTYTNFTIEEQDKILLSKRSNNYLNTNKLESYCKKHNIPLKNIRDSVRDIINEMKNHTK
jgi:3,5-epimerase/4-reductase